MKESSGLLLSWRKQWLNIGCQGMMLEDALDSVLRLQQHRERSPQKTCSHGLELIAWSVGAWVLEEWWTVVTCHCLPLPAVFYCIGCTYPLPTCWGEGNRRNKKESKCWAPNYITLFQWFSKWGMGTLGGGLQLHFRVITKSWTLSF